MTDFGDPATFPFLPPPHQRTHLGATPKGRFGFGLGVLEPITQPLWSGKRMPSETGRHVVRFFSHAPGYGPREMCPWLMVHADLHDAMLSHPRMFVIHGFQLRVIPAGVNYDLSIVKKDLRTIRRSGLVRLHIGVKDYFNAPGAIARYWTFERKIVIPPQQVFFVELEYELEYELAYEYHGYAILRGQLGLELP